MPDRLAQIRVLLATRHDHLPLPVRRTQTVAGFVHRTLAPTVCPACDGVDLHCGTCRGRGEIEVMRTRDPYATDRVTPYGIEATGKLGHVPARDAELARLEAQTAPPLATEQDVVAEANMHPYGWERARAAMYAQFDYHALDVALEQLAGANIPASSTRGLVMLHRLLPNPLRAPELVQVVNVQARGRQADPKARGQRNQHVRELATAGVPYAEIAARVGLSARQLRTIINQPEL